MRFRLLLTAAALLTLALTGLAQSAGPDSTIRPARGVRAVWVLRSTLDTPESVRSMVRTVSAAGFDTVLLQVRGRGEAYYRSRIDPRPAGLAPDFDPLALALDLAHEAGLAVHAWVNVNLIASAVMLPGSTDHVARRHPEWLMAPRVLATQLSKTDPQSPGYLTTLARWTRRESDTVEGLYLSPVSADARDYSISVVRELVESYPLDGVHLDYIRYPGETFDFGPAALTEFRSARLPFTSDAERDRLDAAARQNADAWPSYLPESWAEFRRDRLTELVERIVTTVAEHRPGAPVSVAVVPDPGEARDRKGQDWPLWARDGLVDALCPMVYTTDANLFARQVASVREAAGDVPIWAGIGAYRLTAAQSSTHVRLAREGGAAGVALFSYDSLAGQRDGGAKYFAALRAALLDDTAPAAAR